MVSKSAICGLVFLTTAVLMGLCTAKAKTANVGGSDYFNGETGANENEIIEAGDKEGDNLNIGNICNEEHIRHTKIRKIHELERLLNESKATIDDLRKQLRQKEQAQRQSSKSGIPTHQHLFALYWIIPGCLLLVAMAFRSQGYNTRIVQVNKS